MAKQKSTQEIWPPNTGIRDFEQPWEELEPPAMQSIRTIWEEQQERLQGTKQLSRFIEQTKRQWAIETGVIENLYQIDRGITQTLIEHGFRADLLTHGSTDKSSNFVIRVLEDQYAALDLIFDFIKKDRPLSTSYVKELHAALVRSQDSTEALDAAGRSVQLKLRKGDWKTQPNYPVRGGVVYTYCPPEQVASEMDRLVAIHHEHLQARVTAEVEAAWLHHRFSQIHPFQDGNGRVCRALASMVLIREGFFPLVVTRDDKAKYINALEAADGGYLAPLVNLIAALQRVQFRKATALSEDVLSEKKHVSEVLAGLSKAVENRSIHRKEELGRVVELSRFLEEDLRSYLESLIPELQQVMLKLDSSNGGAFVLRSEDGQSHYFWRQIVESARQMDYYADNSSYRAWVSLNLKWARQARLLFAIHGFGRPFSGSLICAPFLQLRDTDENGNVVDSEVIPVAEEGFLFFHGETWDKIEQRFQSWRDEVVVVALKELGNRF